MLDKNNLAQLKELKQQLRDAREFATGVVKGTQRRFGFVVLDDGREIYVSPEDMEKVFPGDTVNIEIMTKPAGNNNDKPKVSAELRKLVASPLQEFHGRYVIRGKGHFVAPDVPHLNRWIFIPPNARRNAKPGDYLHCQLQKHPYPHGKPQATILNVLGNIDQPGIEADYVISKFKLDAPWPEHWQTELQTVDSSARLDATHIPFLTIDAASTADLDDALYAEVLTEGWRLQVAIADPTALIATGSVLDQLIAQRATSVYLPGQAVSMLPATLANELCSLAPDQDRPALLCSMTIASDGRIADYRIEEAMVRSHAKLSYQEVAALLEDSNVGAEDHPVQQHAVTLQALLAVSQALLAQRQRDHIVVNNRQEYRALLNEQRKLERMVAIEKNSAHQLVEECMVAANRCAADYLGEQGLFVSHNGFRPERIPDAHKLAQEQLSLTDLDVSQIDDYRRLMHSIDDSSAFPLRGVLSRLLERSQLSNRRQPHFGMGLPAYTTFTSPIRKYSDFLVHRLIKARQQQQPMAVPSEQQLTELQHILDKARQARWQMEQWLKCQYLQPHQGETLSGRVSQINSNGYSVRLDAHHIEGFVDTRQLKQKYSFDPMRLRLKSEDDLIELDKAVTVTIHEVDPERREIRFVRAADKTDSEGKVAAVAAD